MNARRGLPLLALAIMSLGLTPLPAQVPAGFDRCVDSTEDFREQLRLCADFVKLEDDSLSLAAAHLKMGWAWYKLGNSAQAIHSMRKATSLLPEMWATHFSLGFVLEKAKRYEESLVPLRRALELDPDAARLWSQLAVVLVALDRYEEALRDAQQAARLDDLPVYSALCGRYRGDALDGVCGS